MTLHDFFASLETRIQDADRAELPAFIGGLAELQAKAQLKMLHRDPEPSPQNERLLKVDKASEMLGMTRDYLYRNAKKYPFTVRNGPRQLRFSLIGIERYIQQRRSKSRIDINT